MTHNNSWKQFNYFQTFWTYFHVLIHCLYLIVEMCKEKTCNSLLTREYFKISIFFKLCNEASRMVSTDLQGWWTLHDHCGFSFNGTITMIRFISSLKIIVSEWKYFKYQLWKAKHIVEPQHPKKTTKFLVSTITHVTPAYPTAAMISIISFILHYLPMYVICNFMKLFPTYNDKINYITT